MEATESHVKKIVIIRNAYIHDFGGGEKVPVNLASILSRNGYSPTVVSRSPKLLGYAKSHNIPTVRGWWWSRQNWSGYRIVLTPAYFIWQILLLIWYLVLFLRLQPNIVHAQSKDDFIAATVAAKLLGKRVIWSDHADLKYVYLNNLVWYKNPIGKLVRFCSRGARAIVLTSQSDKRQIEQSFGNKLPSKYQIIYNGIFDRPELVGKRQAGKPVVFAATSRLVADKGIGELIQAFKSLSDNRAFELWLIGEGPEGPKFKKMAADSKNIKFRGFLQDVAEKLSEADIFVHPSYLEGFSISLLEAAMLGKPIIACNVGGNPELIGDGQNGVLIPPRDMVSLTSAMHKLAGDKALREKLGQQARKTYEKRFALEKIVKQQYIPLYEKS